MGGDSRSLMGFVAGAIVGAGTYGLAEWAGVGDTIAGALGGAAGGATSAAVSEGDVGQGALYGGISGAASGYLGAPSGAESEFSSLGGPDFDPYIAGGMGAMGGLMAAPTAEVPTMEMPEFSMPTLAPPTPPLAPPVAVGTPKHIAPETVQSTELPLAQRMEPTPSEVDLLNKLASERTQAAATNATKAAERYPVSGVPTKAQPSPEERFLGISGTNNKLRPIY